MAKSAIALFPTEGRAGTGAFDEVAGLPNQRWLCLHRGRVAFAEVAGLPNQAMTLSAPRGVSRQAERRDGWEAASTLAQLYIEGEPCGEHELQKSRSGEREFCRGRLGRENAAELAKQSFAIKQPDSSHQPNW